MTDEDDRARTFDAAVQAQDLRAVDPPPDELFEALADGTRRRILWYLLEESRTTTEELVDVLLGWELSGDAVAGPEDRERVAITLRHVHLPRLVDAGLVEHDAEDGDVRLPPLSPAVRDLVRFGYRYDRATAATEATR